MTEVISVMDIDDDNDGNTNTHSTKLTDKGKNLVVSSDGKATPWVEKYRPQSLADVAAHRDIVDTSEYILFLLHPPLHLGSCSFFRFDLFVWYSGKIGDNGEGTKLLM